MIHEKRTALLPESQASLTTYVMENSPEMEPDRVRPAVIICPGGGYEMLSDPEKIIVAGFSAGGHLAANLGVSWQQPFLAEALQGANEEWRPNGLLLSYPVLSSGELGHQDSFRSLLADRYETEKAALSLETLVNEQTPPTFLWHTLEDGLVLAENSLLFAEQLRKFNIPYELHIFPRGGHGLSLGTPETANSDQHGTEASVVRWPELFADWVKWNF